MTNTFRRRIVERLIDAFDTPFDGRVLRIAFGNVAREDANHRRPQRRRVIDPFTTHLQILLSGFPFRQAKVVANGGSGDIQAQPKRPILKTHQIIIGDLFRKVVRGQFSPVEILFRTEINEPLKSESRRGQLVWSGSLGGQLG